MSQINDLAPPVSVLDRESRPTAVLFEGESEHVRLSEVVSALSYALDITEGQPPGHAVRTCLIGMRMGAVIRLSPEERSALFYALLLKDLGCSSNAARLARIFKADDLALKQAHKLTDWSRGADSARYAYRHARSGEGRVARAWHTVMVGLLEQGSGREMIETRCERGADIAKMLGLAPATQGAIRALDEHWDGAGMPYNRSGDQIPLLGRIAGLAQTVELFSRSYGVSAAYDVARERRGTWFDPALVGVLESFEDDADFWGTIDGADHLDFVSDQEPEDRVILADENRLDQVAEAFARVIDSKSHYTALHSKGVATIAVAVGVASGASTEELVTLRRAGLLHDIGKLGVSNRVLDKPGKLTEAEMMEMRMHTGYTLAILRRVRRFGEFAHVAASHHERLDGSGYHLGLKGPQLPELARILAVADIAEALSAERPYRKALPWDEVLDVMRRQVCKAICPLAFEGLEGLDGPPNRE